VGAELFNRYDSILLKDTLNNMTDLVYCPRADCQCAVIPVSLRFGSLSLFAFKFLS